MAVVYTVNQMCKISPMKGRTIIINRLLLLLVVQSFATAYNAVGWLTNHLQLDTATVGPHFIQTTRFYEVEIAYSFQQVVDGPCQTL